jgi:septin family protein
MNEHITNYLNYYVELENPQYAVMLIGNWGCGKTFFIKNIINEWTEPNSEPNSISLKPIYIRLNGISTNHYINEKIRTEIIGSTRLLLKILIDFLMGLCLLN